MRHSAAGICIRIAATVCILAIAGSARPLAQQAPEWRYWTPADGTQESYTRTIGVYPEGFVTLRHGQVGKMNLLDGYTITPLPEARAEGDWDFFATRPAFALSRDEAWTVEEKSLKQYTGGRWVVRASQAAGERMIAAIPAAPDRIIVLFDDRVAEFDVRRGRWQSTIRASATPLGSFREMVRSFSGRMWIAGERGVGRLDPSGFQWTAFPASGLTHFESPHAGDGDEVVVAAQRTDGARVLVRVRHGRYQTLATSKKPLRGWRGSDDDDLWILEGSGTLSRVRGGRREAIAKRGPLAGVVYDVATEPGGKFWIASSTGVARYSPPLWRTPSAVAHIDQTVHAITEEPGGRLWFAATEYLLEFDRGTWRVHPLPGDVMTQPVRTASIAVLGDGRIAFSALQEGPIQQVMTFDPRTGRYARVVHPDGREVVSLWDGPDGTAWVLTFRPCAVQVWDGRTFRPVADAKLESLCQRIRTMRVAADRSMWIGTTAHGGGVHRSGASRLEHFGPAEGYPESAVYALFESAPGRMLAGGREALAEFDGSRWRVLRRGMDAVRTLMRARDGALWVASGSGVHRQMGDVWLTNGEAEGLPSSTAYTVFQDGEGRIWAGTSRGVSQFYPETDRDFPRVRISKDTPAETPPDGAASIAFSGTDRWKDTPAERLLFSYRFDNDGWSEFATMSSAASRGLGRGRHRFEVRAMDRNGNIGPTESLQFAVAFPWYQQRGFYAITSVGVFAIVLLAWFVFVQYRELARAKRAAEAANRAKTAFLANMSHEIRTPMNAIMGMTDLAAEMAVNAEQREYLTTAQSASASLLALLNDILDLSKVEAGKLQLTSEDFNLHRCVEDAVTTLKLRAAQKDLALELSLARDVPKYVQGDDLRVRQILLNLLGNAIKFTEHGTVGLRVTVHGDVPDRVRLQFRVTDTGMGLPPEKQRVIFAPFEQGDHTTTRRFGGTGLGLAISRHLVDLMGGRIWVESPWTNERGQSVAGTAFQFTAEFGRASQSAAAAARVEVTATAQPLYILIAEDNAVNQTLTRRLLEKLGHTVTIAADGGEAIRRYDERRPDLVLMDVQMPVMDGFAATAALRQREKDGRPRVPIVALTAHALHGYREHCLSAGMDAYLTKPVKGDQLAAVIAQLGIAPGTVTPDAPAARADAHAAAEAL